MNILNCTTAENFGADLVTGKILQCLQAYPLPILQQILSAAGQVFSKIALDANRLSQLEFTFTPNYDGQTLLHEPLAAIAAGDIAPNLDFVLIEAAQNEGETLARNVFGADTMRTLLFGENKPLIFQDFNSHVKMPMAAYNGVMMQLFGDQGKQENFLISIKHRI